MNNAKHKSASGFCSEYCQLPREFAAGGLLAGGVFALLAVIVFFLGSALSTGAIPLGDSGWVDLLKGTHQELVGILGDGIGLWVVLTIVGLSMIVFAKVLTAESPQVGPIVLSAGGALVVLALISTQYASLPLAILITLNVVGLILGVVWIRAYRLDFEGAPDHVETSEVHSKIAGQKMKGKVVDLSGQTRVRNSRPRLEPVFGTRPAEKVEPRKKRVESASTSARQVDSRRLNLPQSGPATDDKPVFDVPTVETVVPLLARRGVTAQTSAKTGSVGTFGDVTPGAKTQAREDITKRHADVVSLVPEDHAAFEPGYSTAEFSLEDEKAELWSIPEVEKTMVMEMPSNWLKGPARDRLEQTHVDLEEPGFGEEIEPTMMLNRPFDLDR